MQSISEKNVANRAKQKYMHRMGPINFSRIRAQLVLLFQYFTISCFSISNVKIYFNHIY